MTTHQTLLDAPPAAHNASPSDEPAVHEAANKSSSGSAHLSTATISLLGAALLAACGGGGGSGGESNPAGSAAAPGFNNYPKANSDEEAARFLQQSQLASTDADISAVRSADFASFLQQQFAKPMGQTGWDWLESRGYGVSDRWRYFENDYPADFMIWNQLFASSDSMRKRIALALSEFFVVSLEIAFFHWHNHGMAQYWDLLVKNAFGNYRELLEDMTLNPAMGNYLNTKGNQKEDDKGRQPDENYGREIMQLFSIGLFQLNMDGTEKIGSNGKKLECYTQADVTNIARVFTGYDFDNAVGANSVGLFASNGTPLSDRLDSSDSVRRRMLLDPKKHSNLAASFLGITIPAGTPGAEALKIALDTLFNHPNVGPFFGKQMIQRLVTSNPSPAYVARVASAFNNNGAGVRGDLKAVWAAILLDDEARNPQNTSNPNFGRLREPMLRFVQWGRSFGVNSAAGSWKIFDTKSDKDKLGQSPLRSPSVFNFFRPGFVPPSTALAATMTPAPEFQIVNETTIGGYLNFMQEVIRYGVDVHEPDKPYIQYTLPGLDARDIAPNYVKELELVGDASALMSRINLIMCAGQLSGPTQKIIVDALNGTPLPPATAKPEDIQNAKLDRISAAILLTMANPEYLVLK
jgi:uncharacterized protein (DUF1800 family)